MDGLPHSIPLHVTPVFQQTLKAPIGCVGVGLHSGRRVRLKLLPAPLGTGILFRRVDLDVTIQARFDNVVDTRLCTVLGAPDRPDARIGTVEHLMAALAGAGVTNAIVELDGPEVPIHDGSASSALFLIECAGIERQEEVAPAIEVLRPVRVEHGEAFAELRPFPFALDMAMSIDFEAAAIGRQALTLRLTPDSFRADLARARTFTMAGEVAMMRAAGLALGGSLENAVVVDGHRVLNPSGLRMADEFVRHKLLDAVGDLALAGAPLRARFVGHRTGHALNNRLLRALFADAANWRPQPAADPANRASSGVWAGDRVKAVA
jgi:UDP-3-O-[3-hydroxymyristoyl] N-acetylglucosamine deacetylase